LGRRTNGSHNRTRPIAGYPDIVVSDVDADRVQQHQTVEFILIIMILPFVSVMKPRSCVLYLIEEVAKIVGRRRATTIINTLCSTRP
jgi:hypothetical protein